MTMKPSSLTVRDLAAGYEGTPVLHDISCDIEPGKVTAVLGHNGAGKTTLAKALYGVLPRVKGKVLLDGVDIYSLSVAERLRRGIALVPQEHAVFPELLVDENLRVAAGAQKYSGAQLEAKINQIWELFPILQEFRERPASDLSGGQQRMLSIGMGLMTSPRLLILDEPSLGLSPVLVEQVMQQVSQICNEFNVTVILIEQNVEAALKIADHVLAIRNGRVIHDGKRADLKVAADVVALL